MPGRGRSDWFDDGATYSFPTYLAVLSALYARLDVASLDWVGTSMGGLIGMLFACLPQSPVRRLVLNDIGPVVAGAGLERIGRTVGGDPAFANRAELEAYLRDVHSGFGPLDAAQWSHLAEYAGRTRDDGGLGLAYDPKIGDAFRAQPAGDAMQDLEFWQFYDRISCPTLVLRGTQSDILRATDAAVMGGRGPYAQVIEFAGVGHAPALMADDQIAAIRDFLRD